MEQRREERFTTEQTVIITELAEAGCRMTAQVTNASGRGLGLITPDPLRPGTALKIELPDSFALGEVMYCRSTEKGYFVGVHLEQVLSGLRELERIMQDFSEEVRERRTQLR